MSEVKFRAHTDAVIAALEAAGLVVGDGEAPKDVAIGWQPDGTFDKYVVVYRLPNGKQRSGTLADPYGDAELDFQISCVGASRRQAEWLADKSEVLLAGVAVGGRLLHVMPLGTPGDARQDSVDPPIFTATPRYRLMSTPA